MIRRSLLATAALAAVALPLGHAWAHAMLRGASPAVGSTGPAPKSVILTFTEGVEASFSTIWVQDAKGARVDAGPPHAVAGDSLRLEVPLKDLAPGSYTVTWHATSVDTHKTEGRYAFTVAP
ncbi:MAG: copper resistance protein CopC [Proteobacteria bacterium]|nr:copper resistance protein CopC [Pseudomonadota bacterium]